MKLPIAFQDASIRQKLTGMSLLASSAALVLASAVFMTYDVVTSRASLVHQLTILADIVSFNTSSAVLFNDPASAEKTLASLRARPGLLAARIYGGDGTIFADWRRSGGGRFAGADSSGTDPPIASLRPRFADPVLSDDL